MGIIDMKNKKILFNKKLEATNTRTTFRKPLFKNFNKVPHFQSYNHNNVNIWVFSKCQIIIPTI